MNTSPDIIAFLKSSNISYELNVNLKSKTYIKRGGNAKVWVQPGNMDDFEKIVIWVQLNKLEAEIIGGTSNCYFLNEYNPEIVISTLKLKNLIVKDNSIVCDCGYSLVKLSKYCISNGISGYEGFIGIPGTVGGAAINNAGCSGSLISNVVLNITVIKDGEKLILSNQEMNYRNRNSVIKTGEINVIVTSVEFDTLNKDDSNKLKKRADKLTSHRKQFLELKFPNLGTTFSVMKFKKLPLYKNLFFLLFRIFTKYTSTSREAWQKSITSMILKLYKAGDFKEYVSEKRKSCFTWKDEKADDAFYKYLDWVKQNTIKSTLEIEIKEQKKLKIGILTYHRAHNYGALLQACALKQFLLELGFNAEYVDYWPGYHRDRYEVFQKINFKRKHFVGKMKYLLGLALVYRKVKSRYIKFNDFIQKHMIASKIDFKDIYYDVVIYGSDQIWRKQKTLGFKGFNEVYFGKDIIKARKKITYAASMGIISLNQNDKEFIQNTLRNFNRISVRERDLFDTLKTLTDKNIELVLDPVFLLEKTKWEKISKPVKTPKKYMLFYNIQKIPEANILVKRLCTEMGLDVVEIRSNARMIKNAPHFRLTEDPLEFLYLIKNAEYIVSTSFHGVAFSVIFNKNFYALFNKNYGRVETLLNLLNIRDRLIKIAIDANTTNSINYEKVNEILERERTRSKDFLLNAINN